MDCSDSCTVMYILPSIRFDNVKLAFYIQIVYLISVVHLQTVLVV